MNKNTIYILLIGMLVAGTMLFSSCKPQKPRFTIGFSQCSEDEWRKKMNTEMRHETMMHSDIDLIIRSVTDDTEKQIEDIGRFIDEKVDLIIVSPNKAAPVTPIVEKAYKAGIPVILVDRKIMSDQYTAFIGADNYQIGKDVGSYIVKSLEGKGKIVEICGLEGSSPATERHQGFISTISHYPEIELLSSVDGAWLKDVAGNKMAELLDRYPHIDAVYAHNDRMAVGAYNAAREKGREKTIDFIGIDAIPGAAGGIEQVVEKKLKATFIYPTNGDKIIQLAINILEKRPVERNNILYTNIVDETNARVLKLQTDAIVEQESKINFLNTKVDTYLSQYTTQRYLFFSAMAVLVVFIVLLSLLYRAYYSKNKLNIELRKRNEEINQQKDLLEQQRDQLISLSRQLEEATHAKLVFFTNISHEFRTPLTLISGPINTIMTQKEIPDEARRLLSLAQKNVGSLLKLVDQIVDFRKYENGKLTLNLSSNDLHGQLLEWNESFRELSKRKHLRFEFSASAHDYTLVYDTEKMERIYFNLLSNAFKFTPERGSVSILLDKRTDERGEFALIRISNSGKGISQENIQHIFERFYQIDSHLAGSGIGLALVKALVELHQGSIEVENEQKAHEQFTTFTVLIPFRTQEEAEGLAKELVSPEIREVVFDETDPNSETDSLFEEHPDKEKNLLLVVDDNPDIRSYIKAILKDHFRVIEAKDGSECFKKAVKYIPDLIISDVMMPPPDGVELCRLLKQEPATNHIPVILLTACSLDEQRIIGFESGADEYVSKPFNPEILLARVHNLIDSRRKLKELFQQGLLYPDKGNTTNEIDKGFLDQFRQLVEERLSDSELNVESLGQEMGFSRTQLYRKVKSLTDYSPNELLRIIRIKKAFTLLSSSELNISEIAYETGFTSPSYFAKCYKDYYGESPTDYQKKIK